MMLHEGFWLQNIRVMLSFHLGHPMALYFVGEGMSFGPGPDVWVGVMLVYSFLSPGTMLASALGSGLDKVI